LVIADDVEDLQSIKTSEGREKTFDWYTSEILPVGDQNTKFVLIGNLLHTDSLMMRMKAFSERQSKRFVFKEYPLVDEYGSYLWPGKYPTSEAIEREKAEAPSERAYYREYLLKILPDNMQIVKQEDIKYYDKIPDHLVGGSYRTAICVDLAISKKTSADYTAIVILEKHGYGKDAKIFVHPYPLNKRNLYSETVKDIVSLKSRHTSADIYIEDVGMQRAIIEMLDQENMQAEAVPLNGRDKEERLQVASFWINNGTVQFPLKGCDQLIKQVVGFGVERDDLLDALTLGVIHLMEKKNSGPSVVIMKTSDVFGPAYRNGFVSGAIRTRKRRYNAATASDEEFFSSPTGIDIF
jgi:phage terminase large subunit-like protein